MTDYIATQIRENAPYRRIKATCGVCSARLYDYPGYNDPPIDTPSYIETAIVMRARVHREATGHDSLDVEITPREEVEPIDCTITVNKGND